LLAILFELIEDLFTPHHIALVGELAPSAIQLRLLINDFVDGAFSRRLPAGKCRGNAVDLVDGPRSHKNSR
jgi:hypothetical protein